jgi:hypothetical protein
LGNQLAALVIVFGIGCLAALLWSLARVG